MSKIKCFLLDDQINSIERLKSLLYQTDHVEVIGELCDPEKAIDLILQQKPELVFIDVEMPRMSGFDVVQEIRKNLFFPKFIFVTAYDQYAIKAIRAGAFDYILKPIDIDDLRDALDRFQNSQKKYHIPKDCCLSEREKEVVELVLDGKTSKEIGEFLNLSKHTIDSHRRNILDKTNVKSFQDLIRVTVE
ncbi:response regulator transcription factor [Marinifilum flexuosum]|uniref:response regulator transcription factor n=1 Tax=Marinifilum flexuosum TaxID=1117708 RepID=UPI00248F73CA|nr:response regulator transcription factor [Marinifilum flexuosum]